MKTVQLLLTGALGSWAMVACASAAPDQVEPVAKNSESLLTHENSTYFTLRPDFRRCVSPLCGGFFVKAVNRTATRCADGSAQAECYVAELNLTALGLSPEQERDLRGHSAQFLLRGSVQAKAFPFFGRLGEFDASEAWRGHDGITARGRFFRARNSGIVCITFPCPSISAVVLNASGMPLQVASLDLSDVSRDPSDGFAALDESRGLLLAATRTVVTGPARRGIGLDASEYYLPVEAKQQLCGSRGLSVCAIGKYCNFPPEANCGRADAPGVCSEQPSVCTKQYDPVCGCDGETYGNACMAAAAGVSVEHAGACSTEGRACGTIVGLSCATGEFCDFGFGQCRVSDAGGVCRTRPELCPQIFAPVCGCDGATYSNACVANAAGVRIDHEGRCP